MRTRYLAVALAMLALVGCGSPAPAIRHQAQARAATVKSASGQLELIKQPEAGAAPLIALIDGAKQSIDFKIYMVTMSGPAREVVAALQRAARRGVAVRAAIEAFPYQPEGNLRPGGFNAEAVKALLEAGANVMYTRPNFKYSHEKSLVIDGATAVVMTGNVTKSSFTTNREFAVVDRRGRDVLTISRLFQADWVGETPLVPINPDIVVSPDNSRAQLTALVAGAQKSLIVESNSLQDASLLAMAGTRAKAGVDVKVLVPTARNAGGDLKTWKKLRDAGISQIRFLEAPYLHAKVIVADNAKAYIGSENLTANSLDNNRELGLLLDDPAIVAEVLATNAEDWKKGKPLEQPVTDPATPSPPATGSQPISPIGPILPPLWD
ncbi:MAG: phosphatidylserine/phosphatidylglycerophosphate/cardiolipin synthase family protein [Candidatus Sericytochromatia bacterium]|nr:phosphatidylserine/phosphatidylglycerophosphate/cardiolipin synthase family protein [Candidatus Tanganyikabacteria bacterium]